MLTHSCLRRLSTAALALAVIGAASILSAADPATQPATQPAPKIATTADLGGADRYLSYVSTDKPIYRPSEKVFVRAIVLNAANHQPLPADKQTNAQIKILGPKGDTVATGTAQSTDSVVGFDWTVPDTLAGGEYTLKVDYPWQGYAPSERKFDVRVYRAPRLRSQITFIRDGYGAGDKVTATLHTERAEGGIPANAKVTVIARVDDAQVYSGPATVDANGNCSASFDLPKTMARGEGTLAFDIEDGGTVETASKTIPILLQTVDLQIYPEGGDAVAGVDNRYYIEAKTPAKKPADLVGEIDDSKGHQVATVKTEHEGRGRFDFTPAKGETYTLKLSEPAGISKTWTLPAAKDSGVVIRSLKDVVGKDDPVQFQLKLAPGMSAIGTFKVTVSRHEVDMADSDVMSFDAPGASQHDIKLKPGTDGVLTLTVWDAAGMPLAERLIYRQPQHQINVAVTPEKSTYTPGGKAALNITTTDETGKPISAVVGLTVTDDSVLEMIDKREQAPRLPAMVMLEPEVKDLADAHVYFDPKNPNAARDVDLLLGTQGWRRFALVNTADFLDKYGDQGRRVLADVKPAPPPVPMFAMGGGGGGFGGGGRGGAIRPMAMAAPGAKNMVEERAAIPEAGLAAGKNQLADALPQMENKLRVAAPPQVAAAPMMPAMPPGGGGGGFGGGAAGGFAPAGGRAAADQMRRRPGFNPNDPGAFTIVREYAHDLRPDWSPTTRSDFSETLYWNAAIKTDDKGQAKAAFSLADSVTTYRITADSFSAAGALGTSSNTVQSVQPFYIEPKMPLEVTTGDIIQLPVTAINNQTDPLDKFSLAVSSPELLKQDPGHLSITDPKNIPPQLAPGQRLREVFTINAGSVPGDFDIVVSASAGAFTDKVTRKIHVKPKGFPTQIAYGGLLDQNQPASKDFTIPISVVPGSMTAAVAVFPSPVANMTAAVEQLLREPCGCFEQTSSSNYPVAMAGNYFRTHQGVDPALVAKTDDLLTKGYQRLIGFECTNKGYEWFGGNAPGHEALTAYGLMEFKDMQEAKPDTVDPQMIARTRTWLLGRRDGKGGFERNAKSVDSFGGAPDATTNAYITWALLRAGETAQSLQKEIAAVRDNAQKSDDSYVTALAANVCTLAADPADAQTFMVKLSKKQDPTTGGVGGAVTSITRSGGEALAIETTSLATQAWLKDPKFAASAQNAVKFLADNCKGGKFGSTQSTVLALQAITTYDVVMAHPKAPGKVTLLVDNKPVGTPEDFTADTKEPLKFVDFASGLTPGQHSVALQMADGSQMPFSMAVHYNSTTPSSDKECKLDLTTTLKDATLDEGGITEERVTVTNTSPDAAASPTAIIGIPGGLEVRVDQLKELVKAGTIAAYEIRGREVILYWRQIKAGAKADFPISLIAAVPGTYTAPASRAYEYYTDEFKIWKDGTTVTITAK